MQNRALRVAVTGLAVATLLACSDDDQQTTSAPGDDTLADLDTSNSTSGDTSATPDSATPDSAAPDSAAPDASSGGSCGAGLVEIGFYNDANCANQVNSLTFDLTQQCFGWTRNDGAGGTRDNSATHFQCYRDRLCYTQHVQDFNCATSRPTDKVAYTDQCLQEPTGQPLWARILTGTESCPAAPAGFECPESETSAGTPGTSTACGE